MNLLDRAREAMSQRVPSPIFNDNQKNEALTRCADLVPDLITEVENARKLIVLLRARADKVLHDPHHPGNWNQYMSTLDEVKTFLGEK